MFRSLLLVCLAFLVSPFGEHQAIAATDDLSSTSKTAADHLAAERKDLPAWVRSAQLPFSFQYGGKPSAALLPHWKRSVRDNGREGNKHKYVITYRDEATRLEVTADLTLFTDFPAVDWVVRFKNAGAADTPLLENVFPLDQHLTPPDDVVLHYSQGSTANSLVDANKSTGYDFQPYDKKLTPGDAHHFVSFLPSSWANSSEQWLPFFNLQWKGGGMLWAVGWSGRWKMDVIRDAGNGVLLRAGQNTLRTTLRPGESIRTPRMALLFWQGDDAIQGHNQWRQLLIAHYLPRYNGQLQMTPVAAANFDATGNGGPGMNELHCLKWINAAKQFGAEVFWLDACWFQPTAWGVNDHFGTWDPNPTRFPRGLKVVADAAHANGMQFLVWFMEHAVRDGSYLLKTHPEWVFNGCWDFSNPKAVQWLTDYMTTRIRTDGIDCYRHDGGLGCVTAHDTPDRQGVTENHAVEGWYTYWDALRRTYPGGLPIDNCAGGGRNIDLETMSRSLPYWRSDACSPPNPNEHPSGETYHQVQTAGLSLYVPLHAAGMWNMAGDAYCFRSMTTTGVVFEDDITSPQFNVARAKANVEQLKSLRELWLGDFYPLTEIGVNETKWCGWQFHRTDLDKGCVTLFRRPKSAVTSMDLKLHGIAKDKKYRVTFVDAKQQTTMTGDDLARLRVEISTMPGSVLIVYQRQAAD
jgi:alpha-galactosidase